METAYILMAVGALLLTGMLADEIGHRTRLPRVTLLILCGLAAGPAFLDLLPLSLTGLYDTLSVLALSMVAFLLGGKLSKVHLKNSGRSVAIISACAVAVTAVIVFAGLSAMGFPVALALILAALATATDPAATNDVIRQDRAEGPFTTILSGIVALDDIWGILVFAICLTAAQTFLGTAGTGALYHAIWEVIGSILLGVAIGLPGGFLSGRLRSGDPTLAEALGIVFLTAGLALWLDLSFLLAGIACGAMVVNSGRHHSRPFHEIEHIEWPFMIFFFVLAGASLQVDLLVELGALGTGYVLLRIAGRLLGGWLGGRLTGSPGTRDSYLYGLSLLPQAGVALGMALVAAETLPQFRYEILTVAIGSTVVFELLGPALTQQALRLAGESGKAAEDTRED
ncbi:cation:proton antiporter [Roseibium marinum]|uniref:Kef-type K+ transport system membrane component KefB n=1 Tax=Roseibium marinum TaxID=281252 RepID=A0A2S3US66_9HYPH|nr:cation:proton antiporter [Roseibium marinum]POF30561.1 Kef-type K+ transport system membrane component KefB [Roseibium marinum]